MAYYKYNGQNPFEGLNNATIVAGLHNYPNTTFYLPLETKEIGVGVKVALRAPSGGLSIGGHIYPDLPAINEIVQVIDSGEIAVNNTNYRYVTLPIGGYTEIIRDFSGAGVLSINGLSISGDEICPTPFFSRSVSTQRFGFDELNKARFVRKNTFNLSGQINLKNNQSLESAHKLTKKIILNFSESFKTFEIYENDLTLLHSMPNAFVESINFDKSRYVGIIPFTITISAYDSSLGDFITDIRENYSYNEDNNNIVSIDHSISCRGLESNKEDALQDAKNFISERIAYASQSGIFVSGIDLRLATRVSTSESINKLTGEVSYDEKFVFDKSSAQSHFIYKKQFEISENDGIASVSLSGSVQGHDGKTLQDIRDFITENISTYDDCNTLYKEIFQTTQNLHGHPRSISHEEDEDNLTISIRASYDNAVNLEDPLIIPSFSYSDNNGDEFFSASIVIKSQYGSLEERLKRTKYHYSQNDWENYIFKKYIEYGYCEKDAPVSINEQISPTQTNQSIYIDNLRNTDANYRGLNVDLTCVAKDGTSRITAITPRHVVIFGAITSMNLNLTFVTKHNVQIQRTLDYTNIRSYNNNNIHIGLLNSALPATIKPARILPHNWNYWISDVGNKCYSVNSQNDLIEHSELDMSAPNAFSLPGAGGSVNIGSPIFLFSGPYTVLIGGYGLIPLYAIREFLISEISYLDNRYIPINIEFPGIGRSSGLSRDFVSKSFSINNSNGDISLSLNYSNNKLLSSSRTIRNIDYTMSFEPPIRQFSSSKILEAGDTVDPDPEKLYVIQDLGFFSRAKFSISGSCTPSKNETVSSTESEISSFLNLIMLENFGATDIILEARGFDISEDKSTASFSCSWNGLQSESRANSYLLPDDYVKEQANV